MITSTLEKFEDNKRQSEAINQRKEMPHISLNKGNNKITELRTIL